MPEKGCDHLSRKNRNRTDISNAICMAHLQIGEEQDSTAQPEYETGKKETQGGDHVRRLETVQRGLQQGDPGEAEGADREDNPESDTVAPGVAHF